VLKKFICHATVLLGFFFILEKMAFANEQSYSTMHIGIVGLNTIPTARMDEAGTIRFGASHTDPHNHAFLGMQIARPLYINLRQSMLVSSIGDKPKRVYPGMDIKLRITKEDRYMPEFAFGMDSAIGHKRYSSEYFALSKRFYDFDVTTGIAWGRMGSAGHIKNPFARLSNHFERDRDFTDENAAGPQQWFTGKEIGFFAGVEYFTPIRGFSFKADIGADRYPAETSSSDFKKPAAWSIGLNYKPKNWIDIGASLIGGDKVMARLSFQNNLFNWRGKSHKATEAREISFDGSSDREKARKEAIDSGIAMGKVRIDKTDISSVVVFNDYEPAAMQIGRAARHLASNAGPDIRTITIIPVRNNIRGKMITLSRRDLESAIVHRRGSPEEIWHDASFKNNTRSISDITSERKYKIFPEVSFSFGEEDTSHLHRVSIIAEETKHYKWGFYGGNAFRLNLDDRLYQLDKTRPLPVRPVRSDVSHFARNTVTLDRSFLSWMHTIKQDFHLAVTAGYLEEMYAGLGGEVLYRPFDSPLAIGAEFWRVQKRDPASFLALGIKNDPTYTGHLNLYYDVPDTDITLFAKAGKYLGNDLGGTAGIETTFGDVKLRGHVTATNKRDLDVFGKDTSLYAGLQLSLPLGNIPYVPQGSAARFKFEPMGRDAGQALDKHVSLYAITEPMSYRHLGRNWQSVLD
jgi:hypothetical protein